MTRRDAIAVGAFVLIGVGLALPFTLGSFAFFPFHTGAVYPWKVNAPEWVAQEPMNANVGDAHTIIYPDTVFTRQEIEDRHLPLWNPHNFAGLPHQANPLTGIFYPLNALLVPISDPITALGLSMAIHVFLAGLFTYLYLRSVRAGPGAACCGGLGFALSGWMAVHLHHSYFVHTMVWLPLALFAIEHILNRRPRWSLMVLAIAVACMALGGFPQTAVINAYFLAAYALVGLVRLMRRRGPEEAARTTAFLAGFAILGVLLAAVQIGPTLDFAPKAGHQDLSIERLKADALRPASLIHLVMPDFFGNPQDATAPDRPGRGQPYQDFFQTWLLGDGAIGGHQTNNYSERTFYPGLLLLLLAPLVLLLRRDRVVWTLGATAVISVLTALGTPLLEVVGRLPKLDFGSPMRFTQLAAFALPCLGALALDRILPRVGIRRPRLHRVNIIAGVVVVLPLFFGLTALWVAPGWMAERTTDVLIERGIDAQLGAAEAAREVKVGMVTHVMFYLRRNLTLLLWGLLGTWGVLLAATSGRFRPRWVITFAALMIVADLAFWGVRFNLPVHRDGLYATPSPGLDFLKSNLEDGRFLRFGKEWTFAFYPPNTALVDRLSDAQGFRALTPQSFLDFMRTVEPNPHDVGYANLADVASLMKPQLGFLGVKYVISPAPIPNAPWALVFPHEGVAQRPDMFIYQNPLVLPRVQLVHTVHVLPPDLTREEFAALPLVDPANPVNPFQKQVWLSELRPGMRSRYPAPSEDEPIQVVTDRGGLIVADVAPRAPGLLVVNEQYSSGWTAYGYPLPATADDDFGKPEVLPIIRANTSFMAVPISERIGRVELQYEPYSFKWGGLISGFAIVFLLLVPLIAFFATPTAPRFLVLRGPDAPHPDAPRSAG